MNKPLFAALAVALSLLATSEVSARGSYGGGSSLYNPENNPNGTPTPEQFFAQEYARRRGQPYCFDPRAECAGPRPGTNQPRAVFIPGYGYRLPTSRGYDDGGYGYRVQGYRAQGRKARVYRRY